jgi:RNA polymerase sigma-70 factor (ECF subfamily)
MAAADRATADPLRDRAVRDCVERLPDAQRSAVRLHYWLGETVDEIAVLLGTRPGTVKSWLFRARELVARCLASKGVEA